MLRIVEQIKEGFNLRKYTEAVFPDVAKAFDKVWYQGLLLKMHWSDWSIRISARGHSSFYTSDIPATVYINFSIYADDVCIFAKSRNARIIDRRIQTALDTLQAWYAKWNIAIHPGKARPCFSREAASKEESTATQLNLPSASSPGDLRSNTWASY
ncbi:hypothetical protein Trydic_g7785 [Trypoxylus dichotomus]